MGGSPYGFMGAGDQTSAATVQNSSGIPSDWTGLAQNLGFMPNPYASPAQQMMDATRFLSLQKNIMDQMMGTNNAWNKLSPGNPVQAMPAYMRNLYNSYGSLVNSPAGMMLSPGGSQGMLNQGGYQLGSMGNNMSPLLQSYLGQMQGQGQQGPTQSDVQNAAQGATLGAGNVGGQSPGGGAGGGGSQQPGSPQSNITANTSGFPLPRSLAIAMNKVGINTVPQGVNMNNWADNLIAQALGGNQ